MMSPRESWGTCSPCVRNDRKYADFAGYQRDRQHERPISRFDVRVYNDCTRWIHISPERSFFSSSSSNFKNLSKNLWNRLIIFFRQTDSYLIDVIYLLIGRGMMNCVQIKYINISFLSCVYFAYRVQHIIFYSLSSLHTFHVFFFFDFYR